MLAFEAGLAPGGVFPLAVLLEVKISRRDDRRTERVAGELSQPGGIVIVNDRIYVSDALFTDGAGRLSLVDTSHRRW